MSARRVVVIHPGGLGDVLLSLQALEHLRNVFPRHQLVLVSREFVGDLLALCGKVDRAYSFDTSGIMAELLAGSECLSDRSREVLGQCDIAVVWQADEDGACASALRKLGIERIVVESPFSPRLSARHQSQRFLETLSAACQDKPVFSPLRLPDEVAAAARRMLRDHHVQSSEPLAVVHPGSGSPYKCCAPETLAAVVDGLRVEGVSPVVVQGPADAAEVRKFLAITQPTVRLLQDLELQVIAGVLSQCRLFLGHDSGLTHLAACLGVPTVAMFGPTDCRRWAPVGPRVTVVSGPSCVCRDWEMVRSCVEKPCLRIAPGDVLSACFNTLKAERAPGKS